MNRKAFIQATVLALSATLALGTMAQTAAPTQAKVVFQVSDGDAAKWNLALNNAKNVQDELGADKVDIEIVAYGPGIGMLKADATTGNRVTEATKAGMKMVACENTMKNQKLGKEDMHAGIGYVPAGVVQLMQRQKEGWAYIRP
ncbi:MAG: DsrE family protein [Rhodoferax sp.]|nr:DsrE family protein [Rhodoferax sp.]